MHNVRSIVACLSILGASLFGVSKDDVLSVKNGRFYLDGKPFAEISFNKFDLFWQLFDQANSGKTLDDSNAMVMAQDEALRDLSAMGLKTIRIFGLPWGNWNFAPVYADPEKRERVFHAAVTKALDLCDTHNIRVVYSLAAHDFTDRALVKGKWEYGEEHVRDLMTNPASRSRKRLYAFLDDLIARYKGRRAVAMWEIGNEATLGADIGDEKDNVRNGHRQPTLKDVAGFYDDVAKRIKAIDPMRIVNNGGSYMREHQWHLYTERKWVLDTFEDQYKCFDLLFAKTAVDVIDIHSYPNNRPGYTIMGDDGRETILDHTGYMKIAQRVGKPLMIGELGAVPFLKDDKNKKIWESTPDYFESYDDVPRAKMWVQKAVDGVVSAGVPLTYWWCYASDRAMDKKRDRHDLRKGRDDELIAVIMDANRRLKEKLGVTSR